MRKGDVINTLSDNRILEEWIGSCTKNPFKYRNKKFIDWYVNIYKYSKILKIYIFGLVLNRFKFSINPFITPSPPFSFK